MKTHDATTQALVEVIAVLAKRAGPDGLIVTIDEMEAIQTCGMGGGDLKQWVSPVDGSLHLVWSDGARQ